MSVWNRIGLPSLGDVQRLTAQVQDLETRLAERDSQAQAARAQEQKALLARLDRLAESTAALARQLGDADEGARTRHALAQSTAQHLEETKTIASDIQTLLGQSMAEQSELLRMLIVNTLRQELVATLAQAARNGGIDV